MVGPIYSDEGIKELYEEPIIAWRIETVSRDDGSLMDRVTPVVVDHPPLEYILRRPDRSMFVPVFVFSEAGRGPITNQSEALDWFRAVQGRSEGLDCALQEAFGARR